MVSLMSLMPSRAYGVDVHSTLQQRLQKEMMAHHLHTVRLLWHPAGHAELPVVQAACLAALRRRLRLPAAGAG